MRRNAAIAWVLACAAALGGLACVRLLSAALVPFKNAAPPSLEYVPGRGTLKFSAFGFDAALADVLWLRSIQYFHGEVLKPRDPAKKKAPLLGPLAEAITDLDPNFLGTYYYGSLFLRIMRRQDEALRLLEKGELLHPREFIYPYEIGNTAFFDLRDLELPDDRRTETLRTYRDLGIEAYKRAALKDGVPDTFPRFFSAVLSQRGEFEEALENFRIRYEREKRPEIKEYWKGQIRSSFHAMVLNALRRAGDDFRKREGRVLPAEAVPGLPGFEKLQLRTAGRAGKFALFRTRSLTVPPAGTFAETVLYDPERGTFGGLFRIAQDDLDRKLAIRDAAARYRGERGALPSGRAGIEALVASGCLPRAYPHPLSGGYVLDAGGEPVSEDGWEEVLRKAGE